MASSDWRMPASATRATADAGSKMNFHMPAEWEPHKSTWLAWPTNHQTWLGRLLKEVQSIHLAMIAALLPGERVDLLVPDKKTAVLILSALASENVPLKNLIFHQVKTQDAWIRDYGPIFVKRGRQKAFTKWTFNGWGKYRDLARDNGVVDRLDSLKKMRRLDPGIVLEGGSIDVNGKGVCLTTEQCLLNPNRNPKLSRWQIEGYLRKYLGAEKVIWLIEGIVGDDTDGHVDDIARFVSPNTILAAVEPDKKDANHAILEENLQVLRAARDISGRKFRVVALPMPARVGARQTVPLPASYANFYIGNRVVLVPIYSQRNDAEALRIIQKCFPARRVVGIECAALVHGLGSIHCVTQQESL